MLCRVANDDVIEIVRILHDAKASLGFESNYCTQCNTQLSSIQLMATKHKAQSRGLAWALYHSE